MKSLWLGLAIASLVFSSAQAETSPCHALKFDSYFVAGNVRDNIKRVNSDLTHANFNEKYLLLRAELAMETLYLIASCSTGEFFHEKLSGNLAIFSLNGPGVDLKDAHETTHYEWDGKSWLKGETVDTAPGVNNLQTASPDSENKRAIPSGKEDDTKSSLGSTIPTPPLNLQSAYQALYSHYPARAVMTTACSKLDYTSNFRAQKNKDIIQKYSSDTTHPNFAGNKLLLRTEAIFETVTLIADCATGKFSDDFLTDHVSFQADSRLVISHSSATHPELHVWSDDQWLQIPDPTQSHKDTISNTLYREKAKVLLSALANPKHLDVLNFENLKSSSDTSVLFHELGVDTISSGKCRLPKGQAPTCEITTQ